MNAGELGAPYDGVVVQIAKIPYVLRDRRMHQTGFLRYICNSCVPVVLPELLHGYAVYEISAVVWNSQVKQYLNQCRLACTGWTDDTDGFASTGLEADFGQHRLTWPICKRHVLERQRPHLGHR